MFQQFYPPYNYAALGFQGRNCRKWSCRGVNSKDWRTWPLYSCLILGCLFFSMTDRQRQEKCSPKMWLWQTPRNVQMIVRGQRVNAIAFMNFEGLLDVYVTQRSINKELFEEFLVHCLIPSLNQINPIQARGSPPNVFVRNSQSFCDNSLKFGDFLKIYLETK